VGDQQPSVSGTGSAVENGVILHAEEHIAPRPVLFEATKIQLNKLQRAIATDLQKVILCYGHIHGAARRHQLIDKNTVLHIHDRH